MLRLAGCPLRLRRRQQPALTLVEVLVVTSAIALLFALLLPAVQRATESARRAQCASNLRQLGLALTGYHDAHGSFPPGCQHCFGGPAPRRLAWSTWLLPWLDEQPLYDAVDKNRAYNEPPNDMLGATVVSVFVCPTSGRGASLVAGLGPSDYAGIYSERLTGPYDPIKGPRGMLIYDRAIRLKEVVDGASRTLIVAEDTMWLDGQWINGRNVLEQAYPINAAGVAHFDNEIRSDHPGGANGLAVDGAVHFLAESMDTLTLGALCTRACGEPVAHWE